MTFTKRSDALRTGAGGVGKFTLVGWLPPEEAGRENGSPCRKAASSATSKPGPSPCSNCAEKISRAGSHKARALGYPPFAHLISLCVSGKTDAAVRTAAERWAAAVKEHGRKNSGTVTVLGPIPASVERVRGRHRRQILVKSPDGDHARQSVKATLEKIEAGKEHRGLKFDVTVDPLELG